ncbi:MAG: hypothetical protein IIA45_00575 [Bacteroidetes bacterium]|nr:hypothetical protein [Bacteroidota bacterium]
MKYNKYKYAFILLGLAICIISFQACRTYYFRSNYRDVNELLHNTDSLSIKPFLKAHMKNGDVYIIKDSWVINYAGNTVLGFGSLYDFNRNIIYEGEVSFPVDSVAIFETNKKLAETEAGRIAQLTLLTAVDVLIGVLCITNPKACFGSCPTFYMNEDNNFHYADAEGFSNAILPSLEYYDIDALNNPFISDGSFSITMKNEALETHCVNNVKLLAYPRKEGQRIYHSPSNDFYLCENTYPVTNAIGPEGDIRSLVSLNDREERFSLSDEHDLNSREEIFLSFDNVENSNDLGLLVNFRQTLMTTYFIYSAIGYMGDEVGDIFTKMELNPKTNNKLKNGIRSELGDIDVYVWDKQFNEWELQNGFFETGPIAFNNQILPLNTSGTDSSIKIKLVLNKGLWRIDYLALTNIRQKIEPLEILPKMVLDKGMVDKDALARVISPDDYLISMPGDEYKFKFILPAEDQDYELFLYSKGYYLEWMREHWLKDKNLLKLRQMIQNPSKYLKVEAAIYKQYESQMEQEFWNSRIDTKEFSYYEN